MDINYAANFTANNVEYNININNMINNTNTDINANSQTNNNDKNYKNYKIHHKNYNGKKNKNVTFAVPGSKVFISKYYKNNPNSFINISLTGKNCELLCKHCKGILLKDMEDINFFYERFKSEKSYNQLNGVLFSGGFNKDGVLILNNDNIKKIEKIKFNIKNNVNKNAKFYMHLGFIDKNIVKVLNRLNFDCLFVNVIADIFAIKEVYNLKNIKPEDFYENIKILKDAGLKVSPHIIIGLNYGKIETEFDAVKNLSNLDIDSLVFVIAKNLYKNHNFLKSQIVNQKTYFTQNTNFNKDTNFNLDANFNLDTNFNKDANFNYNVYFNQDNYISLIFKLFEYSKILMPKVPITLGCARPPGEFSAAIEKELLKKGINVISFPSDSTVEFAVKNKYNFSFKEDCCAGCL